MKKENKIEESQSRREFFKKTAMSALPILIVIALFGVPNVVNASMSSSTNHCTNVQQEQIVNAYYYNGGVNSILIRVQGNYIVAYCSGRDYQGRQIWNDIQPIKINRNYGPDRSVNNAEWVRFTAQKKYCARFGQTTIYF